MPAIDPRVAELRAALDDHDAAPSPGAGRRAVEAVRALWVEAAPLELAAIVRETKRRMFGLGGPVSSWWGWVLDVLSSTIEDDELVGVLTARSDLEILREVYRGVVDDAQLAELESAWVDEMIRALDDEYGARRAPPWVPSGHWWWTGGAPTAASRASDLRAALAAGDARDVAWRIRLLHDTAGADAHAWVAGTEDAVAPVLSEWWRAISPTLFDADAQGQFLACVARSTLEFARELYPTARVDSTAFDAEARRLVDAGWSLPPPTWLPLAEYDRHWWWGRQVSAAARTEPTAAVVAKRAAPVLEPWVTIPGGRFVLGLLPDEVDRLAVASAQAARARMAADPDPLHGLRQARDVEETLGNPDFLRPLLAAAFPPREVELERFQILSLPVSNGQWRRFLDETGLAPPDGWLLPRGDAPERAVLGVSWEEASGYAAWAGAALPSEAEWERAARGAARRLFPWGNAWGDEGAWLDAQPFYEPWPSGTRPELASAEGTHDLVTRRWEWVADAFELGGATLAALEILYPALRADGRTRKGGEGAGLIACALARTGTRPSWRADGTGFRLARRL